MVPANPSSTVAAMVPATDRAVIRMAAPQLAPSTGHQSTCRRPNRLLADVKLSPTSAAPPDHSAE